MQLIIVDPNQAVVDAAVISFKNFPKVTVIQGKFEDLGQYDCIVSAGNSFGIMDGGVDLAISQYFGWDLQKQVQAKIIADYSSMQPVGSSFVIETGHDQHPYLAHTPTMRIPEDIRGTDNVYQAMAAMLSAVKNFNVAHNNAIKILACPGLGTATGKMEPVTALAQMALAYSHYLTQPAKLNWVYAFRRMAELADTF